MGGYVGLEASWPDIKRNKNQRNFWRMGEAWQASKTLRLGPNAIRSSFLSGPSSGRFASRTFTNPERRIRFAQVAAKLIPRTLSF